MNDIEDILESALINEERQYLSESIDNAEVTDETMKAVVACFLQVRDALDGKEDVALGVLLSYLIKAYPTIREIILGTPEDKI